MNKRQFKKAFKKLQTQTQSAMASSGGYNAGSFSRPSFRNWNPGIGDANADIVHDLPTIRARSRDLARNAPIGGAAINTAVTNVIGTGLSLQSNPDSRILGWSEDQAAEWKKEVESEYLLWGCSVDCDASRQHDIYGLQGLAFRSMLESGDVLALTPSIRRNTPYSLAIQLVESDRLCNKDYQSDTESKIQGVTLDKNGAAISYDISDKHPGAYLRKNLKWTTINAYGSNGRRNVLHLYQKTRPGQVRGVPYLAPVIEHLKQLARYSEAELQAAVISAALAIFVKMDADAFETLFDGDSSATYLQNASSWNGSVGVDMDDAGRAINLLPGESVDIPELGRPNANYDPFFLSMLKQIGPVLEIPFEVLIKHFSSSYSASRAALLDFWRFVRVRRDFMETYFCQPIYELWFSEAVALGRISAPGFYSSHRLRKAYTRAKWTGDSQGSIDPEKEIKAAIDRINSNVSTLEDEVILFSGGDWESNMRQRAKEKSLAEELGLTSEDIR